MQNLEYSKSIPKFGYEKFHICKRCPYGTKSLFYMVNHTKRHRLPLELVSSERNDVEKYYCKDCNFETDLLVIFKQHLREYHIKSTDCVQDQPKNDTVVKSYICQKCSFETYSVLLWIKHLESSCFGREEECEKVDTVSSNDEMSYRREYYFRTRVATVLKKHQRARQVSHRKEIFRCFDCKYKGKTKNHLREHVNKKHTTPEAVHWFHSNECQFISKSYLRINKKLQLSADAVEWYNCDKCEFKTKQIRRLKRHKKNHLSVDAIKWYDCDQCKFKTKRNDNLKQHKKIHLSGDAVQWYSCNECEYKTKQRSHLKRHRTIHLSADAVQWYSCDKCEYKTKYNSHIKQHKIIHLSADAIQWYNCDKCEFKTKRSDNLKQHFKKSHLIKTKNTT